MPDSLPIHVQQIKGTSLTFGVIYDPHFSDATPQSRKDDYPKALWDKMLWVEQDLRANGASFLLFTGDITHKSTMSTKFVCTAVRFFRDYAVPIYGIAGNHDVYAGSTDFMNRTSLGILFASGVIRKLEHLRIEGAKGFSVHVRGFDYAPAFHVKKPALLDLQEAAPWAKSPPRWHLAVAHGFTHKTHSQFTTKDYVNVPSFSDAGYHALFLGHDHVPYEPEVVGKTLLCRGGSLSRGTKHLYQRARNVQYHLVTVDETDIEVTARPIPCAPPEDVYSEQQIEREDLDLKLRHFIQKFKESKTTAAAEDDIYSIIEGLDGTDPEVKQLCFQYLQQAGVIRQG